MPFQSEEQRKYLWANEPAIAKRWEKYPKGYNTGGVSHLFRSKEPAHGGYVRPEDSGVLGVADGGRIGFFTGMREQEQREKERQTRGPRDDPDRGGPVPTVTPTKDDRPEGMPEHLTYTPPKTKTYPKDDDRPDPHGGDWELGWLDKSLRPGTEEYIKAEKGEHFDSLRPSYEKLTDKTNQYILDNLQKLDPDKYYEDMNAFKKFIEVGKSIPTPTILGLLKALYDEHKLTSEGKGILDDWKQYVGGPPGSNPEAYDALWLALEKRKGKYRYKGEEEREGDKTTTTIEEDIIKYPTQEEMMAASRRAYEMLYGDRRRAEVIPEDRSKQMAYWRSMMAPYMSAQGGRVPQGYNSGGLSNLFRLKNR